MDNRKTAAQKEAALQALIAAAKAKYDAMTPEQRAAHDIAQRESFVRGQLAPEGRQTVPVESTTHATDAPQS